MTRGIPLVRAFAALALPLRIGYSEMATSSSGTTSRKGATRGAIPGWPRRSWISTIIGVTSPRRLCRQSGGEAPPDWRAFRGSDLDPA